MNGTRLEIFPDPCSRFTRAFDIFGKETFEEAVINEVRGRGGGGASCCSFILNLLDSNRGNGCRGFQFDVRGILISKGNDSTKNKTCASQFSLSLFLSIRGIIESRLYIDKDWKHSNTFKIYNFCYINKRMIHLFLLYFLSNS